MSFEWVRLGNPGFIPCIRALDWPHLSLLNFHRPILSFSAPNRTPNCYSDDADDGVDTDDDNNNLLLLLLWLKKKDAYSQLIFKKPYSKENLLIIYIFIFLKAFPIQFFTFFYSILKSVHILQLIEVWTKFVTCCFCCGIV